MPDEPSNGSSEIAALAQQVETARGKLPLQLDPALLEVLSEREIAAERELAEWIRARRREQRRRAIEAELATERRDRKSAAALRRAEEADARWHRRALAARRRASSQDARLAQLYRRAEWSSRALIAVVVLGMVWAGVNVQHNLVPSGDMSDPLYWLSYGIEAMISIPVITIMVAATTAARWGRELARGKVIFFEAALLGTTVALNTGPHLAAGDLGRAAEYAIAPVMVGVVIWLHAWVSARYAVLIDGAPVIDPDPRTVRVDARFAAGMPENGDYQPIAATNSRRFATEGDTYAAPVTDGRYDANPGTRTEHRGTPAGRETPVCATVQDKTTDARPDEFTHPAAAAAPAPAHAHRKSAADDHPAEPPIGGHPITVDRTPPTTADAVDSEMYEGSAASGPTDARRTNGHAVDTPINGHPVTLPRTGTVPVDSETHTTASHSAGEQSRNGHEAVTGPNGAALSRPRNGHSHDLPVNGYPLPIHGETNRTPTNGNAHPHTNGHASRPATNGHIVPASPADGTVRYSSGDGNTAHPSTDDAFHTTGHPRVKGHDIASAANGHSTEIPTSTVPPADPVDKHTEPLVTKHPTDAVAADETPAPQSHPLDVERGTSSPAEAPASDSQLSQPAAQQISLADLHDGFAFREHPSAGANGVASPHASTDRDGRSIERAHHGDEVRHPGSTEPMRTPPPATADTAAQVHPNATAPRAKRGKSATAEQNDRSADTESEQLALEEAPEPSRPRVEPIPVLEADDDEDDEFPTEPEEADTDDDEISAIARAITGRRLSHLPIEEVREILTLADQGGSTPAIANELGLPRSAVTRVLDSALKVHRPYATIV
ncbi:hypothetical protein U3653_17285 [Nocardia sp. CDC186]|uniref:Uncharacterized protein n=1 Tax=Nocardia implantans TaxID=3108168 RepID=A0ABU6AWD1_9NOCA|nr:MULTISPECIES: hypothetical protein [unclassified Nocardia]MBF6192843.1 hypothetical protein [Nocardia beijingensis]MEA3531439.1 hypothetical protein [Nocardia sp. CDC192]MEB3511787.1 hypothetical protein [Nocardia sp. CDC186]